MRKFRIDEDDVEEIKELREYDEWEAFKYIQGNCNLPTSLRFLPFDVWEQVQETLDDNDDFATAPYSVIYADDNKVVMMTNAGLEVCCEHNGWEWCDLDLDEFLDLVVSGDLFEDWPVA